VRPKKGGIQLAVVRKVGNELDIVEIFPSEAFTSENLFRNRAAA